MPSPNICALLASVLFTVPVSGLTQGCAVVDGADSRARSKSPTFSTQQSSPIVPIACTLRRGDPNGEWFIGNGTWVASDKILTAAHVLFKPVLATEEEQWIDLVDLDVQGPPQEVNDAELELKPRCPNGSLLFDVSLYPFRALLSGRDEKPVGFRTVGAASIQGGGLDHQGDAVVEAQTGVDSAESELNPRGISHWIEVHPKYFECLESIRAAEFVDEGIIDSAAAIYCATYDVAVIHLVPAREDAELVDSGTGRLFQYKTLSGTVVQPAILPVNFDRYPSTLPKHLLGPTRFTEGPPHNDVALFSYGRYEVTERFIEDNTVTDPTAGFPAAVPTKGSTQQDYLSFSGELTAGLSGSPIFSAASLEGKGCGGQASEPLPELSLAALQRQPESAKRNPRGLLGTRQDDKPRYKVEGLYVVSRKDKVGANRPERALFNMFSVKENRSFVRDALKRTDVSVLREFALGRVAQ